MRATTRTKGSVKQTTKVMTPTTRSGSGPNGPFGVGGQRSVAYRTRVPSATSRKHAKMETNREVLCDGPFKFIRSRDMSLSHASVSANSQFQELILASSSYSIIAQSTLPIPSDFSGLNVCGNVNPSSHVYTTNVYPLPSQVSPSAPPLPPPTVIRKRNSNVVIDSP